MKLKQLHEKASWDKLDYFAFREKATKLLMSHEEELEKLRSLNESLEQELLRTRNKLRFLNSKQIKSNRQTNYKNEEDNTKQSRSSQTVPIPNQ